MGVTVSASCAGDARGLPALGGGEAGVGRVDGRTLLRVAEQVIARAGGEGGEEVACSVTSRDIGVSGSPARSRRLRRPRDLSAWRSFSCGFVFGIANQPTV